MYEIRMFGDPGFGHSPIVNLSFRVEVDKGEVGYEVVGGLGVLPEIVDGWMMGDWISVPIRCKSGSALLEVVRVEGGIGEVGVSLPAPVTIQAGQIRPIALRLHQTRRIEQKNSHMEIMFTISCNGRIRRVHWHPDLKYHDDPKSPFIMTFASPSAASKAPALVSYAMVVPPQIPASIRDSHEQPPVILALHGAGVDASIPFWAAAMPKVEGMWAVLPTGKNEWGEDWHGGSMEDAWAARDALPIVLTKIGVEISDQTILAGHSNGGQGAWHLAARYPDRIVGGESSSTAMADGSHCSIWLAQDPGLRSISAFVSRLYYTL
jgi:hypothetical protein